MSETCRGHLWEKIIVKLFASSWYIFLTYIYDARSHLHQVRWSSRKLPLFLSDMEWGLKSLDRFSKNSRTSYFMKIYPVESNFPCRRTDRRKWGNSWSVFAILWKHIKQLLIITFRVQHRICILAKQLVLIFFIQTNKTPVNVRMCSPARDS